MNNKCEHCVNLCAYDYDLGEEIDYYSCDKKNNLDMEKYDIYSSYDNEVMVEDCKYYLCDTCKFKKEILEENKKDISIRSDELQYQFNDIWEYGDR